MTVNKSDLTEQEIRTQFITPAMQRAGWEFGSQVREEFGFTAGQIIVKGKQIRRGRKKLADYMLQYRPNLPLAVVEAKDNSHSVGGGMQQALAYAAEDALDVPFVFSSNGDGFLFHDKTATGTPTEQELPLDAFPSPEDLWTRYCQWKGLNDSARQIVTHEYHNDGSGKEPRYYQLNAINRTVEAIARGDNRVLLVMATGTGKTYTAFQIIWRLWKAGLKKRILFLADRNILVDQTMVNDFKPFRGRMAKLSTRNKTIERDDGSEVKIDLALDKKRRIDTSYEIYLALYQAVTGPEERSKLYREFSADFFDLIIIDECHRGSADEDSQWREILEYFSTAAQVGMTATPKETRDVSNIDYFGHPAYTYTLKQGIQDGFLAPYRVVRIDFDRDLAGWRPQDGQTDRHGHLIEDRIYNQRDFDRSLVLEERTRLVARKVTEFLKKTSRMHKTIVFCEDIDHAERMRQALVNENADMVAENRKYVMRITGDNAEGKAELDNFIDPESDHPVIVTTSKLMSTGVDAQTCQLVVLDRRIGSMTEFKQIIGRGTRINEEYGKYFFTIMDFRQATQLFADPDFDGPPICIYQPGTDDSPVPPDEDMDSEAPADHTPETTAAGDGETVIYDPEADDGTGTGTGGLPPAPGSGQPRKYYVDGVEVQVASERVQYFDPASGKLITESLRDYTRTRVSREFHSLEEFTSHWTSAEKKQAIIEELEERGVMFDALAETVGRDYDPFDLICHVAYDQPPLTRRERAENVRKRNYFATFGEQARAVLEALLAKYADEGFENLDDMAVLRVDPLSRMGTPMEIIQSFGGKQQYLEALHRLQTQLYTTAT